MKSQMLDKYAYGADAILMVYDVTNEKSFVGLTEWLGAAAAASAQGSTAAAKVTPALALVANKIDLEHARVIKSDRHHKFAQVCYFYPNFKITARKMLLGK